MSFFAILKEWERVPVFRLGRFMDVRGPGVVIVIPILDSMGSIIDVRIRTKPVPSQQTMTKDNVPITTDAILYYQVKDPKKAILNVIDRDSATLYAAQTILRDTIGKHTFDEVLGERSSIAETVKTALDTMTENYGIVVTHVELKDVTIPTNLQDAIARQAEAERERRSRIILAEAEQQAAAKMMEAVKVYEQNPMGIELRWMNIIYEVSKENSTIIVIPANIPTAGIDLGPLTAVSKAVASTAVANMQNEAEKKPAAAEPEKPAPFSFVK